jgi:hypothetical protein
VVSIAGLIARSDLATVAITRMSCCCRYQVADGGFDDVRVLDTDEPAALSRVNDLSTPASPTFAVRAGEAAAGRRCSPAGMAICPLYLAFPAADTAPAARPPRQLRWQW